jgi:predicted nucleic acid-binding protein
MILLDTNVLSELMRARPSPRVEAWLAAEPPAGLFISTITEAELRYGVAVLPRGRRRDLLSAALEAMLAEDFAERILPFDRAAAADYAVIAADRQQAGQPISQFDAQIAAIARSRGAAVATRNDTDFTGCGIRVINPWTGAESS